MRKLLYIDSSFTLSQIRARGLEHVLKVRFLDEYFDRVWSAHPVDTHPLSDPDIASVGAPVFERLGEDHVFVRGRHGRFSALASIAPLNAILALVSFVRALITLVRREKITVIRAGDPLLCGLIGLLVARRTGAKLIIRVNAVNDRIRKETGTPMMPSFLRSGRIESFIERQVLSRADGIIAPGKEYADFAIRNGAASDKIKVIRYGNLIDKRHLVEPLKRSLPEDGELSDILASRPWMVHVGRLIEVKRAEDCYDVFRILAKEHGDVGLLMIGDGPLRDTILRRAEVDGLSNRVLLLGNIDQERIAAILVLCTLALSPLTGRALAEVAFAALPVVAYDLDWQGEIIEHSVTGYLAPEGSISQMAEYALMLLEDEPSRGRLGKALRQRAFQLLDPEQQTRNEREVYADALRDDQPFPVTRILHLIPYQAIGGVEIAARSLQTGHHGELEFERQYLVRAPGVTIGRGEYHGPTTSLNNPHAYWQALWRLYRDPPDLLVASLWRSALVLICLKLLRPRTKMVIFLHLAHDVHFVDKLANRAAMYLSVAIWADSSVTLDRRVPRGLHCKGRVVSFLLNQRSLPEQRDPAPEFIFWGRLNAQKGLDRALGLFATVVRQRRDARFTIIGPDGGIEDQLRARVAELGLRDHVVFKGRMRHEDIAGAASRASFYLQTSLDEGMAMSVVEAMQSGLVPVVTPVGEITNYCHDKDSAIFVHEDNAAVEAVLALLADPDQYRRMSCAAANYWQEKPLYRDDFLDAARELIGSRRDEA